MPKGIYKESVDLLVAKLQDYSENHRVLVGANTPERKEALAKQIVSSQRRIELINYTMRRPIVAHRSNPNSTLYDPIKSAILKLRLGEMDEAVWDIFIATHFGKHITDEWKLASNVVGSFGEGPIWTFQYFGENQSEFREMLHENAGTLRNISVGRYSNHRQYQSKKPDNFYRVFCSFHSWQIAETSFRDKLNTIHQKHGQNPNTTFRALYDSMECVSGFGRLAKFDFLTMLGKTQVAPIIPDSVYFDGATGPLRGAKLLFCGDSTADIATTTIQNWAEDFANVIGIGMQETEDSLCNWQKSPENFLYFKG